MTREVVKKSRSPQPDLQKGGGASAVVRALIRDGQRLVLKDFSRSPSWFRRTIGALLARHESAAYRRLDGLHWVPRFLGRQPPDGVLMGFVEIEQWAQAGPRLSSNFFEELQRCLRMVRSRGVLHLDVARNVRVGPGEKPILFDFASSLVIPKCLWFLKPALCKLRSPYDERVVIKLKARHAPHLLRPGDERKLERDLAGEVWIKPVERLLRGGVSLFQEAMSSGFRLLVTRFVYSGLIEIVTWFVLVPWHLLLILLSRFSWEELNQRLGRATPTHTSAPRIHLHAVSVGETAVAENVLREMLPDERVEVVLTAGNRPGLKVARALRQRRPEVVDVALLPWDRQGATRSWLKRLRPDVVAIVETEIWPNLFLLCAEMDIPLLMINARLYAEDVPRYRMMRPFFGHVLGATTWIAVTDENEWKRFLQIGAPRERLLLAGNAKYDQLRDLRGSGMRKDLSLPKESFVICAASTHHPEEKLLLLLFSELLRDAGGKDYQARPLPRQDAGPAWGRVSSSNGASTTGNNTDLRLILAPRDVRRSGPVARQAERLASISTAVQMTPFRFEPPARILDRRDLRLLCFHLR